MPSISASSAAFSQVTCRPRHRDKEIRIRSFQFLPIALVFWFVRLNTFEERVTGHIIWYATEKRTKRFNPGISKAGERLNRRKLLDLGAYLNLLLLINVFLTFIHSRPSF
jgi:hypothetical protein